MIAGCCDRCALRFAGVREPAAYLLAHTNSTCEEEGVERRTAICPICLGCLQHCVHPDAVATIVEQLRSSRQQLRSFGLGLSLPVQLLVRERAAWLWLGLQAPKTAPLAFESIVDVKDVMRWSVCEPLSQALGVPFDPNSELMIHVGLTHAASEGEHHELLRALLPSESNTAKRKRLAQGQPAEFDSIRNVRRALAHGKQADDLLVSSALCPPLSPQQPAMIDVSIEREAVTLTGRYRKLSRVLPQSPWVVDGARKCEGSVQELITVHAVPLFEATEGKFHSAGREDVDVRMLGDGRPFMIELVGPRSPYHEQEEVDALQSKINSCGLIEIEGLRECASNLVSKLMKEGEEAHRKDYRCIVSLARPVTDADVQLINTSKELVAQQLTPMRVLHRRTLMVRQRTIHNMTAVRLSGRYLQLDLTTQAGTYVKEFVHGDFGRTVPSLGSLLGCETDILQLDVMGLQEP